MLQLEHFKLEIYWHQHQQQLKNINNKTAKEYFKRKLLKFQTTLKQWPKLVFDKERNEIIKTLGIP